MCVTDEHEFAELEVTCSDMPGRSKRRSTSYLVKDQRGIEPAGQAEIRSCDPAVATG